MKMNPIVHFELPAEDKKRMADFYTETFGWNIQELGSEMGNYMMVQTTETDDKGMLKEAGRINGGFYDKSEENSLPSLVIQVDDIEESMKKVKDGGGKVIGEPGPIPGVGKFVQFVDTEGNKLSLLQPEEGN